MYIDYLDLAERLNATLPNKTGMSAKIYTWQNRYELNKHGVTIAVIKCKPEDEEKLTWKEIAEDVAVDIKKRDMIEAVCKAYRIICNKLGIKFKPIQIKLRYRKEPVIVV